MCDEHESQRIGRMWIHGVCAGTRCIVWDALVRAYQVGQGSWKGSLEVDKGIARAKDVKCRSRMAIRWMAAHWRDAEEIASQTTEYPRARNPSGQDVHEVSLHSGLDRVFKSDGSILILILILGIPMYGVYHPLSLRGSLELVE